MNRRDFLHLFGCGCMSFGLSSCSSTIDNNDTVLNMSNAEEILAMMRRNPKGIRFRDLCKVCDGYLGQAR